MEHIGTAGAQLARRLLERKQNHLKNSAESFTRRNTGEVCPACQGRGVQRLERQPGDPFFGQLLPCEVCGEARRAAWLEKISRLSPEMLAWQLSGFRDRGILQEVVPQIRRAMEQPGWITLSGPYGTGKSYLLAAIVNEARQAGIPAVYITMAELLQELRNTYDPAAKVGYSSLFNLLVTAEVLALDEVEKYNPTPWADEQTFNLIEHRYRHWDQGLTVFATNKPIGEGKLIVENTATPGYFESRIRDGRFTILDDFWQAEDARPGLER